MALRIRVSALHCVSAPVDGQVPFTLRLRKLGIIVPPSGWQRQVLCALAEGHIGECLRRRVDAEGLEQSWAPRRTCSGWHHVLHRPWNSTE